MTSVFDTMKKADSIAQYVLANGEPLNVRGTVFPEWKSENASLGNRPVVVSVYVPANSPVQSGYLTQSALEFMLGSVEGEDGMRLMCFGLDGSTKLFDGHELSGEPITGDNLALPSNYANFRNKDGSNMRFGREAAPEIDITKISNPQLVASLRAKYVVTVDDVHAALFGN